MRRIGLVVLALALAAVPGVRADTLNVAADAQTSSALPNLRFGPLPAMAVRSAPSGAIVKSYAQFDLSALPASPAVDKTVLRLWVAAVLTPGTIEVVPILSPWEEGSITANNSPELGLPVRLRRRGARGRLPLRRRGHHRAGPGLGQRRHGQPRPGPARRRVRSGQRGLRYQGEHPDEPRAGAGGGAGGGGCARPTRAARSRWSGGAAGRARGRKARRARPARKDPRAIQDPPEHKALRERPGRPVPPVRQVPPALQGEPGAQGPPGRRRQGRRAAGSAGSARDSGHGGRAVGRDDPRDARRHHADRSRVHRARRRPRDLDVDPPARRADAALDHTAVWTGTTMIVWGGKDAR